MPRLSKNKRKRGSKARKSTKKTNYEPSIYTPKCNIKEDKFKRIEMSLEGVRGFFFENHMSGIYTAKIKGYLFNNFKDNASNMKKFVKQVKTQNIRHKEFLLAGENIVLVKIPDTHRMQTMEIEKLG